uniref:Transmembrane protein n=1 Tax=Syphacia muris TaxID=451379 RepID=A0A0N5AXP1_9BILA
MFSLFLPPEQISNSEKKVRKVVNFLFRFSAASFFSYHCFEFLFSPLWMHGFVWSLNQEDDENMGQKGPGFLVAMQNAECSILEKFIFSMFVVLMDCVLFWMTGFRRKPQSVYQLLRLSVLFGFVCGIIRCLQVKQRLYSALHEGFYAYFLTFCNSVILTLQTEDFLASKKPVTLTNETESNFVDENEKESGKIK